MMPLDYFEGFGWISGKIEKSEKSRQYRDPSEGPRHSVAEKEALGNLGYVAAKAYATT